MNFLNPATWRLIEAQNQCLTLCRQAIGRQAPELASCFAVIPWSPKELGETAAVNPVANRSTDPVT